MLPTVTAVDEGVAQFTRDVTDPKDSSGTFRRKPHDARRVDPLSRQPYHFENEMEEMATQHCGGVRVVGAPTGGDRGENVRNGFDQHGAVA